MIQRRARLLLRAVKHYFHEPLRGDAGYLYGDGEPLVVTVRR
jgi:hypothetical protein